MNIITSAAGVISLLDEPASELKVSGLRKLDAIVDEFWPEISEAIQKIEFLHEDKTFSHQSLAALVASKVYYHLGSFADSLQYALGAGDLFDVNARSEYVETIIVVCIDHYTKLRVEAAENPNSPPVTDVRLEGIVNRKFQRCMDDKQHKQALCLALQTRRMDIFAKSIESSDNVNEMLPYAIIVAMKTIENRGFRSTVLCSLISIYRNLETPDYVNLSQCLIFLDDPTSVAQLLEVFIQENNEKDCLMAYQIAFDWYETTTKRFVINVIEFLRQTAPIALATAVQPAIEERTFESKVCKKWIKVISEGMLWKKLIERKVRTDSLWQRLAELRGWIQYLFKPKPGVHHPRFRALFPEIIQDLENIESNWRTGHFLLQRIKCRSENSKGVNCLQYDDNKIVSGLSNNTIKIWDRNTLECVQVLTGHTRSVLCLQYDDKMIVSGSCDSTVRVWNVATGEMVNTLIYHRGTVFHLRFNNNMMVTCSKDRSVAVWDIVSPSEMTLRRVLFGHHLAVNNVDFDDKYIVSASGDSTIKVWNTLSCEFVRTLNHNIGVACLQYRGRLVVSGSYDNNIWLWDIEYGACIRVLEGHEELIQCIRFDSNRIVSSANNGVIKVWNLKAALDPRTPESTLCLHTLMGHTGPVKCLQFDEFQIVSSSYDDTILIWDFLNYNDTNSSAADPSQ